MHSILLSELLLSPCPLESAFKLIAANDTRRCTSCFTWYVDLDCPKTSSSFLQGLYVLERCSKGLPRDVCPLCYQESIDQAIAKKRRARNAHQHLHQTEQHPKALAATLNLKTSLPPYTRRYLARRDVELYQALRDSGSNLPALPARCRHDEGIESLLNLKQERALFLALQDLGAFRYPGMAENMRDREGRTLPDEKIFEIIKQSDCRWNMLRGWVKGGERIYFQQQPAPAERKTRRWWNIKRTLVSGKRLPERMNRANFKLAPIAEVLELPAAVGLEGSVGWPLPNYPLPSFVRRA